MLRLRRYRVFLTCAFVVVVLLYHVSRNAQWSHSQEVWHGTTGSRPHPVPKPPPPPPPPARQNGGGGHVPKIPQLKTSDGVKGSYSLPTRAPASIPDRTPPHSPHDAGMHAGGPAPVPTVIHWTKPVEWFPVADESLIPLPTGKPKPIPPVQFAFGPESPAAKETRQLRMAKVRAEAQRAWDGYKTYAWTHDELMPVSKGSKDPFCGWAATMVDALDTLWLMGLKTEFDDAVDAVRAIDFTTTPRDSIPVFETVIRYLGGLLGAYDVTGGHGGQYRVLLDKAVELAEVLMGAFDTPNRMPVLYYDWRPASNVMPKRASANAGVAELGSLSMEFTRLAQLTGENKYYDAVARITDELQDLQDREGATAIPGIFPESLDASGCNRSAPVPPAPESPATTPGASPPERGLLQGWGCAPQKLARGGWGNGGSYSMGGSQDSTYEYFPKQFALLGGLEAKYRTMHEKVADAVKKHLLYRPMAEGDPDILFSAKAHSPDGTGESLRYEWEATHLTCFLGGMFALGGRMFDRPADVEIGRKLTDGCVWAYSVMPSGVMPEGATLVPCRQPDDCRWNETAWHEHLDPNADYRAKQLEDYYVREAAWEQHVADLEKTEVLRKQTEERRRREGLAGEAAEEEGISGPEAAEDSPRGLTQSEGLLTPGLHEQDLAGGYHGAGDDQEQTDEPTPYLPAKPQTHEEYVAHRLASDNIPPGFTGFTDRRYILRPEAIESVWYMYRITGDASWQEKGWRMFEAVVQATRAGAAHTAIRDVTVAAGAAFQLEDSMESFWLAETLKYFYLLFEAPDVLSLDEWVLNTEAHAFRRPV
ncbi:glycoside hydrolase family 47 protein [Trichocladium antarcticum]|uniref:alpha-1,2-Mannosidase n=1 Tax=Trichocladium antarcticum TaxID=1450529 RepID=A0AAN6UE25_9PEZI|nr:glycoside hydrolase family 47 protein [Trichocladium antarcticum]